MNQSFRHLIQHDDTIKNLEIKLRNTLVDILPKEPEINKTIIKEVTFEDALKELLEIKKNK